MFFKENPYQNRILTEEKPPLTPKNANIFLWLVSDYDNPIDFYINDIQVLENFAKGDVSYRIITTAGAVYRLYHHKSGRLLLKGSFSKKSPKNLVGIISHQLHKIYLSFSTKKFLPPLANFTQLMPIFVSGCQKNSYKLLISGEPELSPPAEKSILHPFSSAYVSFCGTCQIALLDSRKNTLIFHKKYLLEKEQNYFLIFISDHEKFAGKLIKTGG